MIGVVKKYIVYLELKGKVPRYFVDVTENFFVVVTGDPNEAVRVVHNQRGTFIDTDGHLLLNLLSSRVVNVGLVVYRDQNCVFFREKILGFSLTDQTVLLGLQNLRRYDHLLGEIENSVCVSRGDFLV